MAYRAEDPEGFQRFIAMEHQAWQTGAPAQPMRTPNTLAKIAGIPVPTLVLMGGADLLAPPALMRTWASHLPQVRFAEIGDAGHSINWERLAPFNARVLEFCARLTPPPSHHDTRGDTHHAPLLPTPSIGAPCLAASHRQGLLAATLPAWAQGSAVTRLVVPFTPGASNDVIGRMVAEAVARKSGQTWIVENKPGAGSMLGADAVAKAAPDGRTLLLCASANMGILPAIQKTMRYAVERDFTFLARIASSPFALAVNAQFPATSFADFVRLGQASQGQCASARPVSDRWTTWAPPCCRRSWDSR
ncbi:MAG: hypothetical protein H6930_04600 [Rhodoferax sp.]|nr:hypothetical protein [Rhodoferax sp.]